MKKFAIRISLLFTSVILLNACSSGESIFNDLSPKEEDSTGNQFVTATQLDLNNSMVIEMNTQLYASGENFRENKVFAEGNINWDWVLSIPNSDNDMTVVSVEIIPDRFSISITNLVGVYQDNILIDMYTQELQPSDEYLNKLVVSSEASITKHQFLAGFSGKLITRSLEGTLISERKVGLAHENGRISVAGSTTILEEVVVTAKKIGYEFCKCAGEHTWSYEGMSGGNTRYYDNFNNENGGGSTGTSTPISASDTERIDMIAFAAAMWEKNKVELSDAFKNDPCATEVYKKLMQGNTLYNVLTTFMDDQFDINLTLEFDVQDKPCNNVFWNACTDHRQGSLVPIQIEDRYLEFASPISVARTMLHEALHAHLIYHYKVVIGVDGIDWSSFPELLDYAESSGEFFGSGQHNKIADSYRGLIEAGLREFDNMRGDSHNDDFYKQMAWGGLYGADAFQALSDEEQKEIENTIEEQEEAGGCQ